MRYFRARHVATMVSPLIEDGCVVVDGDRIVDVGRTNQINPPHIDEDIDGLLMPGLVNAHTHLELTNVSRPERPGTFQDWLLKTMASMREDDVQVFNRKRAEAVEQGIAQCIKFGVTCVGDVSQNVDIVRPILRDSAIRSVSFGECLGIGERKPRFQQLLDRAIDGTLDNDFMRHGISPHAPYTIDAASYRNACAQAKKLNLPLATHLAETADESEFLANHSGRFAGLYQALGFDPGRADAFTGGPVRLAKDVGLLDKPATLLIHCNYLDDAEFRMIAKSNASVVYCPRTHEYFGHQPHRWTSFTVGEQLCLGTDSCASSPDLNLMDDLRLMHREHADVDCAFLFRTATIHGAKGLMRSQEIGQISKNYFADFVAFPVQSSEPFRKILETESMMPVQTWVSGRRCH